MSDQTAKASEKSAMTGVQKLLSRAAGISSVIPGQMLRLPREETPGITRRDPAGGAYGSLYLPEDTVTVPPGVFIDLTGVLRNDVESCQVADFLLSALKDLPFPQSSVEFGGDSLTYLTMEDRLCTAAALARKYPGRLFLFEWDFAAACYVKEHALPPLCPCFNDGPSAFLCIVPVNLSEL